MRERADRDLVDPGLGDRADVLERDAAGGLEPRAAVDERDRGAQLVEASCCRGGSRRRRRRAPPPTCSSVSHSTSIGRSVAARSALDRGAIEPAARRWLSLTARRRRARSGGCARRRRRRRASRARAARASSCACRGSRRRCPRPRRRSAGSASRSRRAGRGSSAPSRSPVRIARSEPAHARDDGARLHDRRRRSTSALEPDIRVERAEHGLGDASPQTTPGSFTSELGRARPRRRRRSPRS